MELEKIAEESTGGSFFLMVGTAASAMIGALGVIIIARLLGPPGMVCTVLLGRRP
jgi:hypothetical protein